MDPNDKIDNIEKKVNKLVEDNKYLLEMIDILFEELMIIKEEIMEDYNTDD